MNKNLLTNSRSFYRYYTGSFSIGIVCILIVLIMACNNKSDIMDSINGTWKLANHLENEGNELIINGVDGTYTMSSWNGDVLSKQKGKFFININHKRSTFTLTLCPDLSIRDNDTLFFSCTNLDIKEINDSIMSIQKPSIIRSINGNFTTVNNIIYYTKVL